MRGRSAKIGVGGLNGYAAGHGYAAKLFDPIAEAPNQNSRTVMHCQRVAVTFLLMIIALSGYARESMTCNSYPISPTTPGNSFALHDDGTVTHHTTGLMWMRCSLGQEWTGSTCAGLAVNLPWVDAFSAAEQHVFAGYSDWRMPTLDELKSITERACWNPAINSAIFPNTPANWFWTSSSVARSPILNYQDFSWYVEFYYGNSNYIHPDARNNVRLVREK